jgi:Zn ribbon nucleic-acid-binding protein
MRLTMNRTIPFPVVSAPTATKLVPNLIPSEGTMRRCSHGVYIPKGELLAPYCQQCMPGGPRDQRSVVLPSSRDQLSNDGRVKANKHGAGCPECGSQIYLRVKETSDSKRECADCGHVYTARTNMHQRALLVEAEAADE